MSWDDYEGLLFAGVDWTLYFRAFGLKVIIGREWEL
jgi:hypothetical protein